MSPGRSVRPRARLISTSVERYARAALKPPAIATAVSTVMLAHVGVLARERHLAEDEERPVGLDLDRDMRFADEALAQPRADRARQLGGVSPRAGTAPISGIVMLPAASTP